MKMSSVLFFFGLCVVIAGCGDGGYDKDLCGGYKLTRCNAYERVICKPDSPPDKYAVMINGNIEKFAIRGTYITGFASTNHLVDFPKATNGYFLLNTTTDKILEGLTDEQWKNELIKIDWLTPELKRPK